MLVSEVQMNIKGRDNVATWLEAVSPSMPASVANTMADDARQARTCKCLCLQDRLRLAGCPP